MTKNKLLFIAGVLWVVIGLFLVCRGTMLYRLALEEQHASQAGIAISLAAALAIGAAKGRFVLSKTARRNKRRIEELAAPVKIHHLFSKPFYAFICGMMLLGFVLRTFNEYLGGYIVVAAIYCGVGAALIIASGVYWEKPLPAEA